MSDRIFRTKLNVKQIVFYMSNSYQSGLIRAADEETADYEARKVGMLVRRIANDEDISWHYAMGGQKV